MSFKLVFTGLTLIISIVSAIRRKDAAVGSSLGITNLLGIATPVLGIVAMYTGGTVLTKILNILVRPESAIQT